MTFHIKSIKPGEDGARLVMGELEAAIMEFIWANEQMTVRDVHDHLKEQRKIAYTTVMTVMSRLVNKKLLMREKKGRAYVYQPCISKDEFASLCAMSMMQCVGHMDHDSFISLFDRFLARLGPGDRHVFDGLAKTINKRLLELD